MPVISLIRLEGMLIWTFQKSEKYLFNVRTIPSNCPSKQGTAGTKVQLKTNYFTIRQKPNWRLYQYRVEMTPDIDYIRVGQYF